MSMILRFAWCLAFQNAGILNIPMRQVNVIGLDREPILSQGGPLV